MEQRGVGTHPPDEAGKRRFDSGLLHQCQSREWRAGWAAMLPRGLHRDAPVKSPYLFDTRDRPGRGGRNPATTGIAGWHEGHSLNISGSPERRANTIPPAAGWKRQPGKTGERYPACGGIEKGSPERRAV